MKREWSRSRYWLCHFLYSRHERSPIDWSAAGDDFLQPAGPVAAWLGRLAAAQACTAPWLIPQAVARHADDPAYIQSLRLLLKEQRYHSQLIGRALHRAGIAAAPPEATQDLFIKVGRSLGIRYTLSAMLLSDLIDVAMLQACEAATRDPALAAVCEAIIREKRSHIAFHSERLTMEFADFNFVRRNLRRVRLRAMFGAKLSRLIWRDRACIAALGLSTPAFVRDCWKRIVAVLEDMVPYRRDELMSALLTQDNEPYHEAHDLFR